MFGVGAGLAANTNEVARKLNGNCYYTVLLPNFFKNTSRRFAQYSSDWRFLLLVRCICAIMIAKQNILLRAGPLMSSLRNAKCTESH